MTTRLTLALAVAGLVPSGAARAAGPPVALVGVTLIHVEDDTQERNVTVVVRDGRIASIEPGSRVDLPAGTERIDGTGRFVIPTFWDMHLHAHRGGRWQHQYPLMLAHGVTGGREAGSHLASALAARERSSADPIAPDIVWGSPPLDGHPPVLSIGLAAEDAEAARHAVRLLAAQRFDFVKVYDRLAPEAYFALTDEARRLGIPVEGHVPLALTPRQAVDSGQRLIDHLTLLLESCIPGALEWTAADASGDSMELLMDGRLAHALDRFDAASCDALFARLAERGVWQVPTLVQMRGYFHADDPAVTSDPRVELVPPSVVAEWRELGATTPPEKLAAGRAVLRRQQALVGALHRAGVPILAGTDASNEPWVFAGSSVHDELALFVEAGLSPLAALATATVAPRRYAGRTPPGRTIAVGEPADLLVLDADPTLAIANTRAIHAVVRRGHLFDRPALDALLAAARDAARRAG